MIKQLYIKNFKAFNDKTIQFMKNNVIIGENDSGKTTILQALDIFFNQEKIDKKFVKQIGEEVKIGIFFDDKYYEKTYSTATYRITEQSDNISDLERIKYIYIPIASYDAISKASELAKARVLQNTSQELLEKVKKISDDSIKEVINGIDKDLIVIGKETTNIIGNEKFKYEKALDFEVTSEGVPVESRGSGYQKNLLYALLIGNDYSNVILGIDEIENSFSVNNSQKMINELCLKMGQTIFTTHSRSIMEAVGNSNINIIPLYSGEGTTQEVLLDLLDSTNKRKFLIVEGKWDLAWYKKCISLLRITDEYIVLPGGGSDNIDIFVEELKNIGKKCITIKDGDSNAPYRLSKECIELYTPLEDLNRIFEVTLSEQPKNKNELFCDPIVNLQRNKNSVKAKLSKECEFFLTEENPLVNEIKSLIEQN